MTSPRRLTIAEQMRSGHVKRWQIVRVLREQTIGEHMYRVWCIAREILVERGAINSRNCPDFCEAVALALEWALIHDLPEVITGDLATPTKRALRAAVPQGDPIHSVECALDGRYSEIYRRLKTDYPYALQFIKLADLLEAIAFIQIEGAGGHAQRVEDGLKQAFANVYAEGFQRWPDLGWAKAMEVFGEVLAERVEDPVDTEAIRFEQMM